MIYILYNSQYNTEINTKNKQSNNNLANIIFNSDKYSNHINKKKQIIKKSEKKPIENVNKNTVEI